MSEQLANADGGCEQLGENGLCQDYLNTLGAIQAYFEAVDRLATDYIVRTILEALLDFQSYTDYLRVHEIQKLENSNILERIRRIDKMALELRKIGEAFKNSQPNTKKIISLGPREKKIKNLIAEICTLVQGENSKSKVLPFEPKVTEVANDVPRSTKKVLTAEG